MSFSRPLTLAFALAVASASAQDVTSLVQNAVHAHGDQAGNQNFNELEAQKQKADKERLEKEHTIRVNVADFVIKLATKGYDCENHARMCKEPFHCQKHVPASFILRSSWFGIGGLKQRANPQAWCATMQNQDFAYTCLAEKDSYKAAHLQYNLTVAGAYTDTTLDAEASYCFVEGHCVNQDVTKETTMEDAEALCDKRFGGRKTWARYMSAGFNATKIHDRIGYLGGIAKGFRPFDRAADVRKFTLAGCSMGNFHCDVMLCKETYCQKEEYVKKYGHLLKRYCWDDGRYVTNFMKRVEENKKL